MSRRCTNKVGLAAGIVGDALGGRFTSSEGGAREDGQQAVRARQKRQTDGLPKNSPSAELWLPPVAGGVSCYLCALRACRDGASVLWRAEPELGSGPFVYKPQFLKA